MRPTALALGAALMVAGLAPAQYPGVDYEVPPEANPAPLAPPPDPRAARWQKVLDEMKFEFRERNSSFVYALSQYKGPAKVHVVYDPANWGGYVFKFERDGKFLVTLWGFNGTVFASAGDVLYFARYHRSSQGCTVLAYDLTDGKQLWETRLDAAGLCGHSAYYNAVTLGVAGTHEKDTIWITGHEAYGDYIEVLDRKTGRQLAHKVYRQGFK